MIARLLKRLRRPDPREDETPETPVNWRRLFGYVARYWRQMAVAFVALVISSLLSLAFPAVIQQVVDTVLTENSFTQLDQLTLLLLGVFLIRSVSSLVETYMTNWTGEKIVFDLRNQLYDHLQQLSLGFFSKRRGGELISRLTSDVTLIRNVLTSNLNTFFEQLIILTGALVVMLAINWRLSLFILGTAPILAVLAVGFGVVLRRNTARIQDELAGANVIASEVIQSIREVKSFVREEYERERYRKATSEALRIAIRLLRYRAILGPIVGFVGFGGTALILWFGGREAIEGRLSGGELIAFLIYAGTVAGSLSALLSLYAGLQSAIGATRRVFEIIDTTPEVLDAPDAQVLTTTEGRITFENISFSYDERQEVLHSINLDIAPGEIVALVGPSGAGKSTIFNMIPRFYDPSSGRMLIDGIDMRSVTQASLREQIAIVPQETLLFGTSIWDNIRYGRLNATDDEVIAAAKAANVHDFVQELPDSYQTVVGERGLRLSGGQRQRVAIARALLKDPRILLLDEATSSLDSESEHEVQEAFGRLMQNRTTVIIAHRLSTVRIAHRIVVLERGAIQQIGSHDALMAQGGLYARLYEMQFRDADETTAAAATPTGD